MNWGRNGYVVKPKKRYGLVLSSLLFVVVLFGWLTSSNPRHYNVVEVPSSNTELDIDTEAPEYNSQNNDILVQKKTKVSNPAYVTIKYTLINNRDYPLVGDLVVFSFTINNKSHTRAELENLDYRLVRYNGDEISLPGNFAQAKTAEQTLHKTTLHHSHDIEIARDSTQRLYGKYRISEDDIKSGGIYIHSNAKIKFFNQKNKTIKMKNALLKIPLSAQPNLEIVKTAVLNDEIIPDGLVQNGETIEYTYTVTNTGNVALKNIGVQDSLPNGNLPKIERAVTKQSKLTKDSGLNGSWDVIGAGDTIEIVYKVIATGDKFN